MTRFAFYVLLLGALGLTACSAKNDASSTVPSMQYRALAAPHATTAPGTIAVAYFGTEVGNDYAVHVYDTHGTLLRSFSPHIFGARISALKFDRSGNLYVGLDGDHDHRVSVYPPGNDRPSYDILMCCKPNSIAVDDLGYVYVGASDLVNIYKPRSAELYQHLTGFSNTEDITIAQNLLWVSAAGLVTDDIEAFDLRSNHRAYTVTAGLQNPRGLGFVDGKLLVVNLGTLLDGYANSRVTAYDYRTNTIVHAYYDALIFALAPAIDSRAMFFLARRVSGDPNQYIAACFITPNTPRTGFCKTAAQTSITDEPSNYTMAWDDAHGLLWVVGRYSVKAFTFDFNLKTLEQAVEIPLPPRFQKPLMLAVMQ